jgi:hypothetical protein
MGHYEHNLDTLMFRKLLRSNHFMCKEHACHITYTGEDSGYANAVLNVGSATFWHLRAAFNVQLHKAGHVC